MIHKAKICDGKEGKTDVDYCDFIKGGIQKSVRLGDQLNNLKCEDDEIDEYVFVDKDEVNDKLSHEETKEFWRIVSKKLRP